MNVIFLDIDGVLRTNTSDKYWSVLTGEPIPASLFDRKLSLQSIELLNEIIFKTMAKVVITSTWRVNYSLDDLNRLFKTFGFNFDISYVTMIFGDRGEEIQEFLDTNSINKYVVIDDNIKDITPYINPKKIVKCDPNIGLTKEISKQVIDLLI